jgi:DNA-binding SARP family transcriptional activator
MRVVVRVLGPLEVECAGRPVPIGAAKERLLVVVLALNAGRVVPVERLVDAVWGEDPPESAALTVRGLVSRLRKTLTAAGCPDVITTRSPGYLLATNAVEVDVHRFQALAADGRARLGAGSAADAAAMLREALALWRGDQLAESAAPGLTGEAARLAEARLAALEARIDADLATGRQAELVGELEGLCQAHRLRERLWGQRMLALYRCGRQADALAAYQQLRTVRLAHLHIRRHDPLGGLLHEYENAA